MPKASVCAMLLKWEIKQLKDKKGWLWVILIVCHIKYSDKQWMKAELNYNE
jgi:hypothetical protein